MNMIQVVNTSGIPFNVVIEHDGGKYGDVVKFYDARFLKFGELGQFVSDYYLFTLTDGEDGYGLDLYGGVDNWYIDANNMDKIREWLKEYSMAK